MTELRYYPMSEYSQKGFDLATPMKAYQDHQRDLQTQKLAEQAMQLRQQEATRAASNDDIANRQRAIGMQREEAHTNRRDDLYAKQEDRRQGEVLFNRHKLTSAEHEQLIHDLYFPPGEPGTPEYVARQQYAAAALQRAGYMPPEPITEDEYPAAVGSPPGQPGAPAEVRDPTLGGTLLPDDAGARAPSQADAQLSGQLDDIDKTYSKGLGARPASGVRADAALNGQLDSIDQKYSKGLGVQPGVGMPASGGRYLPGKNVVAKSNAMLDPGDPYNRL